MQLFELSKTFQDLVELAATSDDEAEQAAFADTLEGISMEIREKIENCAAVTVTLGAQADAIREQEKRLAQRRKALENSIDRLKTYMQSGMEASQMDKVKGKLFTVAIQNNPPSVAVEDETKIPRDYCRVVVSPDKAAIKDALKDGKEIPGVHLEVTRSLRIR